MKSKIVLSLFLILITVICFGTVFAVEFPDVSMDFWGREPIYKWYDDNVIKGYEDGTYRPDNAITRVEFIAMLDRIFVIGEKADLSNFEDVDPNAWYYDNLAKAVKLGIIKGYSNTEIRPNGLITRQEAMTIIERIISIEHGNENVIERFIDNSEVASWAKQAVAIMTELGYVNGYDDETVRPNANITRAEVAKILHVAFPVVIREAGTYDLGEVKGNVVVTADNVKIVNSNITGGVIVGASLDKEDAVTLENTNVGEKVIDLINDVSERNKEISNPSGETMEPNVSGEAEPVTDEKENKKPSGGGGGGYTPSNPTNHIVINIVTSGDGYVFIKTGTTSDITSNDKITILKEGANLISEFGLSSESTVKTNIKTVFNNLDNAKAMNTVAKYKDNATVKSLGLKALIALSHNESEYDDVMTGKSTYTAVQLTNQVINALSLNDLINLANAVIE